MPITSNAKKVRQQTAAGKKRARSGAANLVRAIAVTARDNVRSNISAPRFPGYAITGALARKTVATQPKQRGGAWEAQVKVQQTGEQKKYALIHEIGGTIRAKNAPYLVFFIPGVGWRKAKQVTIRAKHYFADGVAAARKLWTESRKAKVVFK